MPKVPALFDSQRPLPIGFAFALAGALLSPICMAQTARKSPVDLSAMGIIQPICDAEVDDGLTYSDVPVGSPVVSPSAGIISAVWNDKTHGCGLTVMVTFRDGAVAGFTWLSDTVVHIGDAVERNQLIAHSGQSGNAKAPALHYTIFTADAGKVDPRTNTPGKPTVNTKPFTNPEDLQKALAYVESSGESERVKEVAREGVIERFNKERAIADLAYRDNLKKATDAWYANGKDWKKILPDVWEKLREADRGRLKSGIDPEIQPSASSSPAIPNPAHPSPPTIPSIR